MVPSHRKPWGFPCVWQGCVTSGATCTILSLSPLGKHGSAFAVCRLNRKVSPTLEQRFVLCFSLFQCSGSCSDQGGVGLQLVHHWYQQRPWGIWAPVTNLHRAAAWLFNHLQLTDMLVGPTSRSLIRNPEPSPSGLIADAHC